MVFVQFNANWEYEALSDHFIPRKSKPASPCLFSGTVVVNPASEKSGHLAGGWYHCIGFAPKKWTTGQVPWTSLDLADTQSDFTIGSSNAAELIFPKC